MSRYKVGDVICLIDYPDSVRTIVEVLDDGYIIKPHRSTGGESRVRGIESVTRLVYRFIRNTALARKMYPDHEVDGDYIKVKIKP